MEYTIDLPQLHERTTANALASMPPNGVLTKSHYGALELDKKDEQQQQVTSAFVNRMLLGAAVATFMVVGVSICVAT